MVAIWLQNSKMRTQNLDKDKMLKCHEQIKKCEFENKRHSQEDEPVKAHSNVLLSKMLFVYHRNA